jgi:hypothetical protein
MSSNTSTFDTERGHYWHCRVCGALGAIAWESPAKALESAAMHHDYVHHTSVVASRKDKE